jgi:hypothetical protein
MRPNATMATYQISKVVLNLKKHLLKIPSSLSIALTPSRKTPSLAPIALRKHLRKACATGSWSVDALSLWRSVPGSKGIYPA